MQTQKAPEIDQRINDLLRNIKSEHGISLFNHLCMMYQEHFHEPKNIYSSDLDHLEKLSQFVKKNGFIYRSPKTSEQILQSQIEQPHQNAQYIKQIESFLSIQKFSQFDTITQNFVYLNSLLEQAGYGFSEEESWKIQSSIKRFLQQQPANYFYSVRFWGKMLTNGQDYYIIECIARQYSHEELPEDSEQNGVGVNEYVHYVTQNLSDDWELLPCITKNQIEQSRQIKYVFSGQLNRNIQTYPQFHGQEKHLLKAQIIRISHANLIAPKGLYKLNDENKFEEEFKMPESSELSTLEAWIHVPSNILKLGRITHWVDQNLSEEAKQQKLDDLVTEDPELERLKSIAEDKPYEGYETGWLIKSMGDPQQYTTLEEQQVNYGVYLIRNLQWSGAITVANKSGFINIYIGYGLKNNQSSFIPVSPNDLQEEPEENDEFPEPNPQTLADELETDSDDERRKLQEQIEAEQ